VQTATTLEVLRSATEALCVDGRTLALVPTMGALHDGHLTLVRAARGHADAVCVSIFVNPRQFGPNEDLGAYPRRLAADAALLANEGVELLWAPDPEAMYPPGFATNISVSDVSEGLCGASRPGHFDGVATVVCKLFNQVRPHVALFGEKDWQQLAVIRRMAGDLDLVRPNVSAIFGVPTVREVDGLALSSRNQYLTPHQRAEAAALPQAMREAIGAIAAGSAVAPTLAALEAHLLQAGFDSVDYTALVDAATLEPLSRLNGEPARLLVAARIGGTRLIDNMAVG
jgi:pantoate--beta-alanine ligase